MPYPITTIYECDSTFKISMPLSTDFDLKFAQMFASAAENNGYWHELCWVNKTGSLSLR